MKTTQSTKPGAALAAIRWAGHTRADWRPIRIRSTTLDELRVAAGEMGDLTIDACISCLLEFRANTLKSASKNQTGRQVTY